MVEFGGWEMPVQYTGVIEEHRAVRTAAGLFDVSHMGEFRVAGENAEAFVQHLTPNDARKLPPGRAHYSALLTPDGTFVDDLLVYRIAADESFGVTRAELEEDLRPELYVGRAPQQVDEFLAEVVDPLLAASQAAPREDVRV